jgi:hypothetical protein
VNVDSLVLIVFGVLLLLLLQIVIENVETFCLHGEKLKVLTKIVAIKDIECRSFERS